MIILLLSCPTLANLQLIGFVGRRSTNPMVNLKDLDGRRTNKMSVPYNDG